MNETKLHRIGSFSKIIIPLNTEMETEREKKALGTTLSSLNWTMLLD